jgi:hypothetical protein
MRGVRAAFSHRSHRMRRLAVMLVVMSACRGADVPQAADVARDAGETRVAMASDANDAQAIVAYADVDAGATDAAVDARSDVAARANVVVTFRFVRMRSWTEQRTKRERYETEIEIDVRRPGHAVWRARIVVPNAGCGVVTQSPPPGGMQCYQDAHGEYVELARPQRDTLRISTYGQNEALPGYAPPIEHPRVVASLTIPADADVVLDESFEPVDGGTR